MDTSKAYVEMWLASGLEIKPDLRFQRYVCPACHKITHDLVCRCGKLYSDPDLKVTRTVPLPRQDQLQGMLKHYWDLLYRGRIRTFMRLHDKPEGTDFSGSTPEQALIQGVMHELHGKVWDGEKWEEME